MKFSDYSKNGARLKKFTSRINQSKKIVLSCIMVCISVVGFAQLIRHACSVCDGTGIYKNLSCYACSGTGRLVVPQIRDNYTSETDFPSPVDNSYYYYTGKNAFNKASNYYKEDKKRAMTYYKIAINHWEKYQSVTRYQQETIRQSIAMAYYNIALCYGSLQQRKQSINACKNAIRYEENIDEAYVQMGFMYEGLKQYQQAEQAYRNATKINPNNGEAYAYLGTMYDFGNGVTKDGNTALFFYEKALNNSSSFDNNTMRAPDFL